MQDEDKSLDDGEEIVVETEDQEEAGSGGEQPAEAADGDGELESYSKNVQNRIKKLTEKYRKEERDRQEAVRLAQQLMEENKQLKGRVEKLDSGYLNEYGQRLEGQIASAKAAYKAAYESGDPDAMANAQEQISTLAVQKQRYEAAKAKQRSAPQRQAQPQAQAPAPQQQPKQVFQPDPKAATWAEKNKWFGEDRMLTSAAFAIHATLIEDEGFDPQSDEYYNELDKRLRVEFPHKFKSPNSGKSQAVAPASSSASRSTKSGRRTVRLSPSQIAIAKKLGVPLEEYAKYVKE